MLFAVPPVLILAGWCRGSWEEERIAIWAVIGIATVALVPTLIWATMTDAEIVDGSAYALSSVATAAAAMLLRRRRRPDDGGSEGSPEPDGGAPEPHPFDWDDFERRFWDEVDRRKRDRDPSPRTPVGA
jgi:hypothetical protein